MNPGESIPPSKTDAELAALPAPRRPFRRFTFVVMALTTLFALRLALGLRGELAYTLRGGAPQDLGDIGQRTTNTLAANAWVRAEGALNEAAVVRYSRPLESDTYRLSALADNPKVWVELRVPRDTDEAHFVAPGSFVGRLVPAQGAGLRYHALRDAAADAGHALPSDAWLLIDGESPAGTRWVLALEAMLIAFAAFNVVGIIRLARPVRDA
ncbi:MAG: hypothetical protein ACOY0T_11460 [Myxococcota bacterium]